MWRCPRRRLRQAQHHRQSGEAHPRGGCGDLRLVPQSRQVYPGQREPAGRSATSPERRSSGSTGRPRSRRRREARVCQRVRQGAPPAIHRLAAIEARQGGRHLHLVSFLASARRRTRRSQTYSQGSKVCFECHEQVNRKGPHAIHSFANCVGCHMPRIAKSAESGDIHSHVFVTLLPEDTLRIPKIPNSCQTCHRTRTRIWRNCSVNTRATPRTERGIWPRHPTGKPPSNGVKAPEVAGMLLGHLAARLGRVGARKVARASMLTLVAVAAAWAAPAPATSGETAEAIQRVLADRRFQSGRPPTVTGTSWKAPAISPMPAPLWSPATIATLVEASGGAARQRTPMRDFGLTASAPARRATRSTPTTCTPRARATPAASATAPIPSPASITTTRLSTRFAATPTYAPSAIRARARLSPATRCTSRSPRRWKPGLLFRCCFIRTGSWSCCWSGCSRYSYRTAWRGG